LKRLKGQLISGNFTSLNTTEISPLRFSTLVLAVLNSNLGRDAFVMRFVLVFLSRCGEIARCRKVTRSSLAKSTCGRPHTASDASLRIAVETTMSAGLIGGAILPPASCSRTLTAACWPQVQTDYRNRIICLALVSAEQVYSLIY
jgi:hypothetical protein